MSTIGNTFVTLADYAKRLDGNGVIADVANVLSKSNPILDDIPWVEGNLDTGHRFVSATALPSGTWRKLNQGEDAVKAQTKQVDETCGIFSARSIIDCDNPGAAGPNAAKFRSQEDLLFVSGMGNDIATGLFYNDTAANPERFQGLAPRLAGSSGNVAASQILKWGGSSSGNVQTSIWLCGWAPDKVFGIYPRGSKIGLDQEDLGKQLILDASSKQFLAYVTQYKWKVGVCVRDWRYLVRGCNIDTVAEAATNSYLITMMTDMIAALYSTSNCRPVFYMNRWAFSMLNKQLMNKQGNLLEWIDGSGSGQSGKGAVRIPSFLGIPIKVVDAVTRTEAIIS
jgi:hypothetical protein